MDPNDDSTEAKDRNRDLCEKCFAEMAVKGKQDARNTAQDKVSSQASDFLLARLKEPAQPLQTPEQEDEEVEIPKSQRELVMDLHTQIEALCQGLAAKIHKKHEGLYLNHQHFGLYESTLNEKYQPVFTQMKELIIEKRVDYMNYLNR